MIQPQGSHGWQHASRARQVQLAQSRGLGKPPWRRHSRGGRSRQEASGKQQDPDSSAVQSTIAHDEPLPAEVPPASRQADQLGRLMQLSSGRQQATTVQSVVAQALPSPQRCPWAASQSAGKRSKQPWRWMQQASVSGQVALAQSLPASPGRPSAGPQSPAISSMQLPSVRQQACTAEQSLSSQLVPAPRKLPPRMAQVAALRVLQVKPPAPSDAQQAPSRSVQEAVSQRVPGAPDTPLNTRQPHGWASMQP